MGSMLGSKPKKDREAERLMAEQKQKEDLRLKEEESKLAETKARMKGMSKTSLIKTSERGITSNLSKTTGGAV